MIKYCKEPELESPDLICGWPGIGRIGTLAVDYIRRAVKAEELGEIEPLDFFEPNKAIILNGLLNSLEFPSSKFYYRKTDKKDLLLFIAEEQPSNESAKIYAVGEKAYQLANLVLDVAYKFKCRRIYTSGAAITQTHHTLPPRVWAVPNSEELIDELKDYENIVLMSDIEGRRGQGFIIGLNGLMLGAARKRNIQSICLMGEIPYYLQGSPWPYPKASMAVVKVLTHILGIDIDIRPLENMSGKVEETIDSFLQNLFESEAIPQQIRDQIRDSIEKMKSINTSGPITKEDERRIMGHIDEFFKKRKKGNEGAN